MGTGHIIGQCCDPLLCAGVWCTQLVPLRMRVWLSRQGTTGQMRVCTGDVVKDWSLQETSLSGNWRDGFVE